MAIFNSHIVLVVSEVEVGLLLRSIAVHDIPFSAVEFWRIEFVLPHQGHFFVFYIIRCFFSGGVFFLAGGEEGY